MLQLRSQQAQDRETTDEVGPETEAGGPAERVTSNAGIAAEAAAARGVDGAGGPLPHLDAIQASFGAHDIRGVPAFTGEGAREANEALGSDGYAKDGKVAFGAPNPSKELVAHEAAHAVQGREGGNTGGAGADMERHADAVAAKVGAGESAESLLDQVASRKAVAAAPAAGVQRKEADKDLWAWEGHLLKDVRNKSVKPGYYHWVTDALEKLSGASDPKGKRLYRQMQTAVRRTNFYFQGGFGSSIWGIYRGKSTLDDMKKGKDAPHLVAGHKDAMVAAIAGAKRPAKYAGDPRLTKLLSDAHRAYDFFAGCQTWGKGIDTHSSYVRQLLAMHDAGAVLDHHMLLTLRAPDGVNMWREGIITGFLGDPIIAKSATFKKYETCYGRFLALNQRLKSEQGNGFEKTGRGHTKAELMAMKQGKVPEYVPSKQPKDDRIGATSAVQKDLNDIEARAKELLAAKDAMPGDLYTTITRLKSIRPHVESFNHAGIDQLLKRLEVAFSQSSDPSFMKKDQSEGVAIELDLDKPLSVQALRAALNTVANEPGEIGQVSFKVTVRGSYGNALIKGFVEGWAQLKLFYGVSDTMSCFLGFDLSAAIGAGISLGNGLVEGKVEGGAGFGAKAKFPNPTDAATWMWRQLKGVNDYSEDKTGGRYKPFQLMGSGGGSRKLSPTFVTEKRGFVGASAGVDAGAAGGGASIQQTWQKNRFEKDGKTVTGSYDEKQTSYTAFIKVGGLLINVGYTKTDSETKNDATVANDGIDQNHQFSLEFDLTKVISRQMPVDNLLDQKKLFDIVLKGLSKFESHLPGGKLSTKVIDKLVEKVGAKVFEVIEHGRKYKLGASVTLDVEWNAGKENGKWRNEYVRAGITPKFKASLEVDAKVLSVKAEFEAHKREVVYEKLGTDTSGYVFQRYVFAWDKQQWKDFVNDNKPEIAKLMKNMANPRNNAYDKDYAALVKKAHSDAFHVQLEVLEKYWDTKRGELKHKNLR